MKLIKIIFSVCLFVLSLDISAESVWDKEKTKLEGPVEIVVYRSPTCGCCSKWIEHLKKHNFDVKDIVTKDMDAIKKKSKIPGKLASCHTALVDGYAVEGHVPADDIKTLLKLKPKIIGLSVPAMPSGTPGMEMGGRKDPFRVIAFDENGDFQIFNEYGDY